MTSAFSLPDPSSVAKLSGKRVLVVGDVMLDVYLIGDADRISPEAPVPVVRVERERQLLGGAGNVARNIAALGGSATLVGTVGDDGAAESIRRLLDAEGIRAELATLPGRPTTVKTRVMARHQQMLRLDQEDARPFGPKELDAVLPVVAAELRRHDVVILSDYSKGLVSRPFMDELRKQLAAAPRTPRLLVDPKPANMELYAGAFIMTPNTKETGECAGSSVRGREDILAAGRVILERVGCPHLLTTLGPGGMALFRSADDVWHVPTVAQDVFDVTGAGDTVIGTLGLCLAAGFELLESCVLANYAAGLVVAQEGAAVAAPEALADALGRLPVPEVSRWA